MSVKDAAVLIGGTNSATGGTSRGLLAKETSTGKFVGIIDDDAVSLEATQVLFSTKEPKVSTGAPNGYTQGRAYMSFQRPKILDNGNRTVETVKLELSVDMESTEAEVTALLNDAVQYAFNADCVDFWVRRATG